MFEKYQEKLSKFLLVLLFYLFTTKDIETNINTGRAVMNNIQHSLDQQNSTMITSIPDDILHQQFVETDNSPKSVGKKIADCTFTDSHFWLLYR